MTSILFVCLGNICRSPMADAVMRHQVKLAGLEKIVRVDSAGTGGWHQGETPHEGTREVLRRYGVSDEGIFARKIEHDDFHRFDRIYVMDKSNLKDVEHFARKHQIVPSHLELFMQSIAARNYPLEVPDPYYTGEFDLVYELVTAGCTAILADIIKSSHNQ
jgi:protein-tyrosine phosphatase